VEAQVRGVELTRGINPQPPPGAAAPQPPQPLPAEVVDAQAQPNPPPNNTQQQRPSADPPFDWLAMKVAAIVNDLGYTVDEAVDETLSFLYHAHAPVVAMLLDPPKLDARLKAGDEGLLMLFQHHPILQRVQVNPRLTEFIKKFRIAASQAETERAANGEAKPPAPPA